MHGSSVIVVMSIILKVKEKDMVAGYLFQVRLICKAANS